MGVQLTPRARDLLRRLEASYPELYLLLDDTGCCGPSHVFLQDHPPSPVYVPLGEADGTEVYIHPTFQGGRAQTLTVDAYPSAMDDSWSLETSLKHRLTLHFGKEDLASQNVSP